MSITIRLVSPAEHARVGELILAAYDALGTLSATYRAEMADTGGRVADGAEVWVAVDTDARVLGSVTFVDGGNRHFEAPEVLQRRTEVPAGGQAGRSAGSSGLGEVGDCGFRMLAVDLAAQGRGVGRALVRHCIDHATALGRRRLAIHTMVWMPAAQAMYTAMGFIRRPDRDVVFPGGVGWVYQLDLASDAADTFPPPGPVRNPLPWYADLWAEQADLRS